MDRLLQLSPADQRLTFEQAAARRGLVASSVEKDFWICWALQQLFDMPVSATHLTFKGGTSLSKAWGLIDRFSEDVDLTIHRDVLGFGDDASPERAATPTQRAKRLKALKIACRDHVEQKIMPSLLLRIGSSPTARDCELASDTGDSDGQTLLLAY